MVDPVPPEHLLIERVLQSEMIGIEVDGTTALCLIGQLQVAFRHPLNNGPSSQIMRKFCDGLIEKVAKGDAEVESWLRRGDDPAYDCTREEFAVGQEESRAETD